MSAHTHDLHPLSTYDSDGKQVSTLKMSLAAPSCLQCPGLRSNSGFLFLNLAVSFLAKVAP